jgi:hypothetical protein
MINFNLERNEDVALTAGGSGGVTTGVYDGIIEAAHVYMDSKENPRVDLHIDCEGKKAKIFGLCIAAKWKTGADNIGYAKWQEIVLIGNMTTGAQGNQIVETSKDKKEELNVFTELTGVKAKFAIQETFDTYIKDGVETESNRRDLYRTFFATGHTIAEKKAGVEAKTCGEVEKTLKPYETDNYKKFKAAGGSTAAAPAQSTGVDAVTAAAATDGADLI